MTNENRMAPPQTSLPMPKDIGRPVRATLAEYEALRLCIAACEEEKRMNAALGNRHLCEKLWGDNAETLRGLVHRLGGEPA